MLYGRGNTIGDGCGAAGQKEVWVALESTQTSYNSTGFANIVGFVLYENNFLSSTVADAYAADTYGPNVHAINSGGVIGSFVFGC
jgi:hypothetical protein